MVEGAVTRVTGTYIELESQGWLLTCLWGVAVRYIGSDDACEYTAGEKKIIVHSRGCMIHNWKKSFDLVEKKEFL